MPAEGGAFGEIDRGLVAVLVEQAQFDARGDL
jgi:hypothetical protein